MRSRMRRLWNTRGHSSWRSSKRILQAIGTRRMVTGWLRCRGQLCGRLHVSTVNVPTSIQHRRFWCVRHRRRRSHVSERSMVVSSLSLRLAIRIAH